MATANAKQKIKDALVELLAEKDFEKISILDIVRRAGVGRSTYYYHYFEQREVLDDVFNDVFERFCDALRDDDETLDRMDRVYRTSVTMVDFLLANKDRLNILFFGSASKKFGEGYRDYFRRMYSMVNPLRSAYDRYLCNYLCAGQFHLLQTLVQDGTPEDRDDMVNLLFDINCLVAEGIEQRHQLVR